MSTNEIKPEHIKKFLKLAKQMDDLMREIKAYNPQANLYAEDSYNLNLMKGPSHSDDLHNQRALKGNVVAHAIIRGLGGGGR